MHNVVTWASGVDFCRSTGFKLFVASLKRLPTFEEIDTYVLTHDMPPDVRRWLEQEAINVVNVSRSEVRFLVRDRYLAIYRLLLEFPDYDLCLLTDCKDVVFQRDPFYYPISQTGSKVHNFTAFVSEGMNHEVSDWNMRDQALNQQYLRDFSFSVRHRPVLNGGIVFGSAGRLSQFALLLWATTLRAAGTEQAMLNYLYNIIEADPLNLVLDPIKTSFCLTGEAVKAGIVAVEIDDGKLCNSQNGEPYYLLHQYERTQYLNEVLARFPDFRKIL